MWQTVTVFTQLACPLALLFGHTGIVSGVKSEHFGLYC